MGSERIGRCITIGLQDAGTRRVIQVTVRDQDMRDVFTLKTFHQRVEMCRIGGPRIDDGNSSGANNVGAGAVIGESAWGVGSESADTGSKYFDLSVPKIVRTVKWELGQKILLLGG